MAIHLVLEKKTEFKVIENMVLYTRVYTHECSVRLNPEVQLHWTSCIEDGIVDSRVGIALTPLDGAARGPTR